MAQYLGDEFQEFKPFDWDDSETNTTSPYRLSVLVEDENTEQVK